MVIKFDRPVGAHLDTKELEYISALHQTGENLRSDGTLVAADIVAFLTSRHGIAVDEEFVKQHILLELAGDPEKEPSPVLDLRQVVALLVLPHLVKVSAKDNGDEIEKYFRQVLNMILKDLGRGIDGSETPILDTELLTEILETYGEFNVPEDTIKEMVAAAGGEGEAFDVEIFRCALLADTKLYDTKWEFTESTYWEDIFRLDEKATMNKTKSQLKARASDLTPEEQALAIGRAVDEELPSMHEDLRNTAHQVWTLGAIDQTADTVRSQAFAVLLWVSVIMLYFINLFNTDTAWSQLNPDNFSHTIAYAIANGVSTWCWIFIQLSFLGSVFFLLATLGMSIYDKRRLWPTGFKLCIAMCVVGLTFIGGGMTSFDAQLFDTSTVSTKSNSNVLWLVVFVGVLLLAMQLCILLLVVVPPSVLKKFQRIKKWLTPTIIRNEGYSKRAAGFKTEQLLDNALAMHDTDASSDKSMRRSTATMRAQRNAMTIFQDNSHITEYVGGIWWAWTNYFNTNILKRDGVWFHTRLLTCSFTQFLVMLGMLGIIVAGQGLIDSKIVNPPPQELSLKEELEAGVGRIAYLAYTPQKYGDAVNATIRETGSGFVPLRRVTFLNALDFGVLNLAHLYYTANLTVFIPYRVDGAWYYNVTGFYFIQYGDTIPDGLVLYRVTKELPTFLSEELAANGMKSPNYVEETHFTSLLSKDPAGVTDWLSAYQYTYDVMSQFEIVANTFARNVSTEAAVGILREAIREKEAPSISEQFLDSIAAPEAYAGLWVGGLVAFGSCAMIFILFIPSFVSTVLMFRSGVLPSLQSERTFNVYRAAGDTVTLLFGLTLWGAVLSGVIPGILVGGLFFFAIYDESSDFVLGLLGQLFGIVTTLVFKILILCYLRRILMSAFYRKQPGATNIMYLALEVWNVALALGGMVGRVAKLFIIIGVSLGRLESPILAEKVGWLWCINLDSLSTCFRRDVLAHEAHRHPYIERLGMLYLLKLRFGSKFGTRAGGLWRLIFVSALMPWVRKYRGSTRENPDLEKERLLSTSKPNGGDISANISDEDSEDSRTEVEEQAKIAGRMQRIQTAKRFSMTAIDAAGRESLLEEELRSLQVQNQELLARIAEFSQDKL